MYRRVADAFVEDGSKARRGKQRTLGLKHMVGRMRGALQARESRTLPVNLLPAPDPPHSAKASTGREEDSNSQAFHTFSIMDDGHAYWTSVNMFS